VVDPRGISTKLLMKSLSDDSKIVLGGFFGVLGMPGKSKLAFGMKEVRPTARLQAALDELVEAGALSRVQQGIGAEYTVQINCSEFGRWAGRNRSKGKWPTTEPVQAGSQSNLPQMRGPDGAA
jgi:hypothetical protein